jgi:hypothetical protein
MIGTQQLRVGIRPLALGRVESTSQRRTIASYLLSRLNENGGRLSAAVRRPCRLRPWRDPRVKRRPRT